MGLPRTTISPAQRPGSLTSGNGVHVSDQLLEKARADGYEFEILAKPVHPQDLLARLRS